MSYELRTSNGIIKAVVSNLTAQKLIKTSQGFFKEVKFIQRDEKTLVYSFAKEGQLEFPQVVLPIFPGDQLIPDQ